MNFVWMRGFEKGNRENREKFHSLDRFRRFKLSDHYDDVFGHAVV